MKDRLLDEEDTLQLLHKTQREAIERGDKLIAANDRIRDLMRENERLRTAIRNALNPSPSMNIYDQFNFLTEALSNKDSENDTVS